MYRSLLFLMFSFPGWACVDLIHKNAFQAAVLSDAEAGRFLQQATFGTTVADLNTLKFIGYADWLDQQQCWPATTMTAELQDEVGQLLPARLNINWRRFVYAPDQLRQKVAYALSQILVVSQVGYDCTNCPLGIANYNDILLNGAFGNFRDLLEDVTLNPTMGFYLSMLGNAQADPVNNTRADENFAREIMQLFSIGLVMLNQDGTEQVDGMDQAIPTYNIDHIKELARVFTGWHWAGTPSWDFPTANQMVPMQPYMELGSAIHHDDGAKQIVGHGGITTHTNIPAGLSPEDDLDMALDTIFQHPNVAPFISKQLIQKLVTSNPSPAYVSRVASIFNDNGTGVRGDLAAVVRGVLLDVEARDQALASQSQFGKLREPILRLTHLWRALDAEINHQDNQTNFQFLGQLLGQSPYQAPSVFNFFRPDHQSNDISDPDLFGPAFQLNNESQLIEYQNLMRSLVIFGFTGGISLNFQNVVMDGEPIRDWLLESNQRLIDQIDLLFFSNHMSASLRTTLNDLLNQYSVEFGAPHTLSEADLTGRVAIIIYLALSTPEYLIQK